MEVAAITAASVHGANPPESASGYGFDGCSGTRPPACAPHPCNSPARGFSLHAAIWIATDSRRGPASISLID